MKTPVILLVTSDPRLEDSVAQVLLQMGGLSHLTESAGDALQIICDIGCDLNLAIIDCEHGPHGMTLLATINARREGFPVIVVTRGDDPYIQALAYANGAVACLHKPVTATQLAAAMNEFCQPRSQLALVVRTT